MRFIPKLISTCIRLVATPTVLPAALACLLAVAPLPTQSLSAQMSQYTAPGGGGSGSGGGQGGVASRETIESQMEAARWRLGPVRLAPYVALRGLTWEENLFVEGEGGESDLTGAVSAGMSAYLATGPDVFWIAQAFPEYLWWLDRSDRNQVVGRYGAAVVADLNRLRLTADVRSTEQQTVITSEAPQQVVAENEGVSVAAEVRLAGALWLSTGAARHDVAQRRPEDDGAASSGDPADPGDPGTDPGGFDFTLLDRRETRLSAGLVWRPSEQVEIGAGVEDTETDFEPGGRNLSSTGTSPWLRLRLDGNRISVTARLTRRELEPEPGSELQPVDSTQGSAEISLTPGWRFRFDLYGQRSTVYALSGDYSQFDDERLGLRVGAPFGERFNLRAFYETGRDDYRALPGAPAREDDVTAWGVDATVDLGEWLSYRAGFHQLDYDSNLPGFDRDVTRILSSIVLSTGDWAWQ